MQRKAKNALHGLQGRRGPKVDDIFDQRFHIAPSDLVVRNYLRPTPIAAFNPGASLKDRRLLIFPRLIFDYYTYTSSIGVFEIPIDQVLRGQIPKPLSTRIILWPKERWKFGPGCERNAAIVAAKEAANENDETRKRFEVMCREVFKKFKACINTKGINNYRSQYGAINVVYKSLQQDRDNIDITDIIRQLHKVVDKAITTQAATSADELKPYDISKIDFDRLRKEFARSPAKRTTVQNLKQAIENKLKRLLEQNPLRTDFQRHYERIVTKYNREKRIESPSKRPLRPCYNLSTV